MFEDLAVYKISEVERIKELIDRLEKKIERLEAEANKCPACHGKGSWLQYSPCLTSAVEYMSCEVCCGTGKKTPG